MCCTLMANSEQNSIIYGKHNIKLMYCTFDINDIE